MAPELEAELKAAVAQLDYDALDTFLHALCDAWETAGKDQQKFTELAHQVLLEALGIKG